METRELSGGEGQTECFPLASVETVNFDTLRGSMRLGSSEPKFSPTGCPSAWLKRHTSSLSRQNRSAPNEALPLSRFAFTKKWVSKADGGFRLKYHAFMPRSVHGHPLEVSVFRVDGLSEAQIWEHGRRYALPPGRNFHGRGDVTLHVVNATGPLRLEFDEPPPRHANVVGWPTERDQQLALAQDLASRARSVRPPTNQ